MVEQLPPDYLAKLNPHPRDKCISFDAGPHIYTIHNDPSIKYTSVTTWNHSHFGHFDADKIIDNMMKSKKWPESKYYGMTREEIKASWDKNRDEAANSGTNMHFDIECYYNKLPVENDSIEYKYFQNFVRENPELEPYRTEWTIFHEELKIAGSVDMVYVNPDGTLLIYDWKRCKEIVSENMYGTTAVTPCIRHLPDTNFWHYTLQLNTYRAIIEEKYGMKVVGLCLVCLHPDNCNKNYQIIKVPFIEKEIEDLFQYRREMLVSNEIKSVEKKKAQQGKKKYAKVDAETQTNESDQTNRSIDSFFKADAKKKEEIKSQAKPMMIDLEYL